MTARIVITRPFAQANSLAGRVAAIGLDPVIFPLLDIHPLADPAPIDAAIADLHRYAMVVFVSPNAVSAFLARLKNWPVETAIAVVGEGSRKRLADHGITAANAKIVAPQAGSRMDSEALLARMDLRALRGARILIVRGQTGRELLTETLRSHGVKVTQVAAYRRAATPLTAERAAVLKELACGNNDWILTSTEALCHLVNHGEQALGIHGLLRVKEQRFLITHARIADSARKAGFTNIVQTGGDDAAILDCLQNLYR